MTEKSTPHYLADIMKFHFRRAKADLETRNFENLLNLAKEKLNQNPSEQFKFSKVLKEMQNKIGIIAEIKRQSPSKGDFQNQLTRDDVASLAKKFEEAGAIGISILTDEKYFGGSLDDLKGASQATKLPILRKDFTCSGLDIVDAYNAGASAVLIIMAAYTDFPDEKLLELISPAQQLGLDIFLEIHCLPELQRAEKILSNIETTGISILVNQRDLHTFEEYPTRAVELAEHFSLQVPRIAASAIRSKKAIKEVAEAGYNAVLVGEYLMTENDPIKALSDLKI